MSANARKLDAVWSLERKILPNDRRGVMKEEDGSASGPFDSSGQHVLRIGKLHG